MAESETRRDTGVEGAHTDPRRQAFAEVRAWALAATELFRKNVDPVTRETVQQLLDGLARWAGDEARGPGGCDQVRRRTSRREEETMSSGDARGVPTEKELRELEEIFSRMTAREFEEVVRRSSEENLDLLRPISGAFHGKSIVDVTMWVVGLVVGASRDFPVGARRVLAAMLRKGAEVVEGDAGPGRADA